MKIWGFLYLISHTKIIRQMITLKISGIKTIHFSLTSTTATHIVLVAATTIKSSMKTSLMKMNIESSKNSANGKA
jgi:hypothetical protein